MLKDKDSSAIIAVSDIERAKAFYRDTLELELSDDNDRVLVLKTGATNLVVYVSEFAGSNKANAVVWSVGEEIDAIVDRLRGKGVAFERYEGMDFADGIHRDGTFRAAWFKDPDGNILHFNNM
ncbi:VOC family protein [Devosia sp. CAU 1758]